MQVVIWLLFLVVVGIVVAGIWAILAMLFSSNGSSSSPQTRPQGTSTDAADEIDGMNEGDLHSGPYGYSPNMPYPQTQYGSHFDEDADWAHEHED